MDVNETHISCVEYIDVHIDQIRFDTYSTISILSAKNRHFEYNSLLFFINVEWDPIFFALWLERIFIIA